MRWRDDATNQNFCKDEYFEASRLTRCLCVLPVGQHNGSWPADCASPSALRDLCSLCGKGIISRRHEFSSDCPRVRAHDHQFRHAESIAGSVRAECDLRDPAARCGLVSVRRDAALRHARPQRRASGRSARDLVRLERHALRRAGCGRHRRASAVRHPDREPRCRIGRDITRHWSRVTGHALQSRRRRDAAVVPALPHR
ncbi:hypothetical protein ACVWW7_007434 [Bradyrhizobium sp. LM6.9]